MTKESCKYCKKKFTSEKTLLVHVCVKKQRHADKDTIGSRIGFAVFQRFYELSTSATTKKTFDEFVDSKFYGDFVKFGRYIADLNPISTNDFVDFVIKNGIKMREWYVDKTYYAFLKDFIEKETVERALERTIIEISKWSTENNVPNNQFFIKIGTIEAVHLIRSGRLSPWVIYLASTSETLLNNFNSEQTKIIDGIVNVEYWKKIFMTRQDDVIFAKTILTKAQL